MGPLPIRWVAHIQAVSRTGFTDRQVRGPFKQSTHRHSFVAIDANTTEVVDEVQVELRVATSVLRDMPTTSLALLDIQAQGRTSSPLRSCTLETTEGA